jgi:hypothetical protein
MCQTDHVIGKKKKTVMKTEILILTPFNYPKKRKSLFNTIQLTELLPPTKIQSHNLLPSGLSVQYTFQKVNK